MCRGKSERLSHRCGIRRREGVRLSMATRSAPGRLTLVTPSISWIPRGYDFLDKFKDRTTKVPPKVPGTFLRTSVRRIEKCLLRTPTMAICCPSEEDHGRGSQVCNWRLFRGYASSYRTVLPRCHMPRRNASNDRGRAHHFSARPLPMADLNLIVDVLPSRSR